METEMIEIVGAAILTNFSLKSLRAGVLIKSVIELAQNQIKAKKDGKLTQKEKAQLYDDIEDTLNEAWLILKGMTFMKSKK